MMTKAERAYLDELAAQMVKNGFNPETDDMMAALATAHANRQEFTAEMAAQETKRSKIAAKVICSEVWGEVKSEQVKDRARNAALFDCDRI